jgi:hypothetical protein
VALPVCFRKWMESDHATETCKCVCKLDNFYVSFSRSRDSGRTTPCDVLTSFADPLFYKSWPYETDSAAQNQLLSFFCQWSSYGPVGGAEEPNEPNRTDSTTPSGVAS